MKPLTRIALLGTACFLVSCDRKEPAEVSASPAVNYTTPGASWLETDFTAWMSRAELQYLQENNPPDKYFAHVEGRNHDGRLEYRAVLRPFSADEYDQWAVFWGINESELFDWELRLLRTGFTRKDMQAFQDSTGKALYQIVWLKPKGQSEEQDLTVSNSGDVIAPQSVQPEIESASIPFQETPVIAEPQPPEELVEVVPPPPAEQVAVPEPIAPPPPAAAKDPVAPKKPKTITYVVQPGDTLSKIARRRGVTVAELKSSNKLKSDVLRIGQKLTVTTKSN